MGFRLNLRLAVMAGASTITTAGLAQPSYPCVASDCNRDCARTVQDVFSYLQSYFSACAAAGPGPCACAANFNGDGGVTVQDVFDFLSAYFACPSDAEPDLTAQVWPPNPAVIVPGCPFDVEVDVTNRGNSSACGSFVAGAILSIGPDLGGGDDTPWEERLITLNPPLEPQQTRRVRLSGLSFEGPLQLTNQRLFVCLDLSNAIQESNEANNCHDRGVQVAYDDVAAVSVAALDPVIGGQSVRIRVGLRSFTSCRRSVPVQIELCGVSFPVGFVDLPGLATGTVTYTIVAPSPLRACGQPAPTCVLSARANLGFDRDRSNDLVSTTVSRADPFWALNYQICAAPPTPDSNGRVTYTVCVRNSGTALSPQVCSRTGICRFCGDYTQCIGGCGTPNVILFDVPPLAPNATFQRQFTVFVCGGAIPGTQRIQAGVDTFRGCCDTRGNLNICRNIHIP